MGLAEKLELEPGDLLTTINFVDVDNNTPGEWNHMAIYVGDDMIVESQESRGGVVSTPLSDFWGKYLRIRIFRLDRTRFVEYNTICDAAIASAKKEIGVKYWMYASIKRHLRPVSRGENCVSLVRRVYSKPLGFDPGWKLPDNLNEKNTTFKLVYEVDKRA